MRLLFRKDLSLVVLVLLLENVVVMLSDDTHVRVRLLEEVVLPIKIIRWRLVLILIIVILVLAGVILLFFGQLLALFYCQS